MASQSSSRSLLVAFFSLLLLAARRDLEEDDFEMPSKRRSGYRPSQDRTDTWDTLKTIDPFYVGTYTPQSI